MMMTVNPKKVLAISQGSQCGVAGTGGYRGIWTLSNLALSKHCGSQHLALFDTLGIELCKGKYDAVAYELVETMTIQTAQSVLGCQFAGVILAASAMAGARVIGVDPKVARSLATGSARRDPQAMVNATVESGERFKELVSANAYWLLRTAETQLASLLSME